MTFSELFDKIYHRLPNEDAKSKLLFGVKDFNTNPITLTIVDGILDDIDTQIHLFEDASVLKKYKDSVSHIVFIGEEKRLEHLDHFINTVTWKRLRDLQVVTPIYAEISLEPVTCSTRLCAECTDLSKLKALVLSYFMGHTMIWLDYVHKSISPQKYEGGLISELWKRRYFNKNNFSACSNISVPRKAGNLVIQGEEFLCSKLERRMGVYGTSIITGNTNTFDMRDVSFRVIYDRHARPGIFEPLYDTVIYYAKNLKEIDKDNLQRCQVLAKKYVIIILTDENARTASGYKVLPVYSGHPFG